ncbi:restriction endonuclease subunit S [Halomonas sp. HMF6819]|uniref:restriction endonuclease subunit S n=1 Tax=Halomonas sp. HMF6819 TaxID=3373085 RepID=UPI0037BA6C9F
MSSSSLPSHWQETCLENCVDILDSQRIPVNNKERQARIKDKVSDQLYPYFGATGEVGKIDGYLFDEELVALGEDGVPFLDPGKAKAYMLSGKTWVNNHAHVLRAYSRVTINRFLLYYLNQFDYYGFVNGGTRLKLTQSNMRKMPFPLPPLAEQKVIADKLDTLLAQVDSIKARLERIPEILKRFRQSVLAAAVSGRLTEEWRIKNSHLSALEELKALRGTRESILASKNKKDISLKRQESSLPLTSLPTSWSYSYIDPFLDITRRGIKTGPFGSLLKKHEHRNSGVPVIGIENISSGKFIEKSKVFITEEKAEALKDYDILSEDMVISRSGTVGDICVVPSDLGPARFSTNIMRLSFLDKSLSPRFFVMLFLGSPVVLRQIADLCKGSTRLFLNQRIIASINYPIPPKREQTEIVRRVDQLFAYADTVERQVNSALARVNQLTQSILAKAFRGELTTQWRADNVDLISGDNSAEALLARIKAERAAQAPKKRTRKKATP